jgi:predicted dehydrogenase
MTTSQTAPAPDAAPSPARGTALRKPVRVAVAGLGRAGIIHAAMAASVPDCTVVGLADAGTAARRRARGIGFAAPAFDRIERLIARTQPDALIVCVPHAERARAVRLGLEAGLAVLADRPLARTLTESEELVVLARERGMPLACAHVLPFHPVFVRAREILASGALGSPRQVRCSVYVSSVFSAARQPVMAPADSSGGVLAHEALDALFFVLELLGMPRAVRAKANRIFGPHEDEAHATLLLPSGLAVGLDASWSVPGYPTPATVLEFEGENGKLLASDDALEVDVTEARGDYREGHTRLGLADLPPQARFDLDGDATGQSVYAFLDWATGGEPPCHRGEQVLRAHRVLDALYRSIRQGSSEIAVTP